MCSLRHRLHPHCHENDLSVQEEEPLAGVGLGSGLIYQLKQMRGGSKKEAKDIEEVMQQEVIPSMAIAGR